MTVLRAAFFLFMEGAKATYRRRKPGLISNAADIVLWGPLWVLLAFGEKPGPMTFVGGALVVGALVWRLAPDVKRGRNGALAG